MVNAAHQKGGLAVDNTAGPFQKQGIVREQRSDQYKLGAEAARLYEGIGTST